MKSCSEVKTEQEHDSWMTWQQTSESTSQTERVQDEDSTRLNVEDEIDFEDDTKDIAQNYPSGFR